MEEAYIRQHLSRYRNKQETKSALLASARAFPDMRAKYDTFVFSDNTRKELLCLDGSIPVSFKGATYNIPICIWLFETYPHNPPMCYVKPTPDMMIKASRHVDASGRVYLPYLHEWKHPNSDLTGLIQVMTVVFGESSPVFARPTNLSPTMFSVQSPNLKAQSSALPYTPTGYSSPDPNIKKSKVTLDKTTKQSYFELARLTRELEEANKTLESSTKESAETSYVLTRKLDQTQLLLQESRTKATQEIRKLTDELNKTRNLLKLATNKSSEEIKTLKEQLKSTKLTLTNTTTQADKDIERLTKELEQTQKRLQLSTKDSAKDIERLTRKLDHTQFLLEDSRTQSTKEFDNLQITLQQSTKEIETLTVQLENTKLELEDTKTQLNQETERLSKQLLESEEKFNSSIKVLVNENETRSKELSQTKMRWLEAERQSNEGAKQLTLELENSCNALKLTKMEYAEKIKTLQDQLEYANFTVNDTKTRINEELRRLTTEFEHEKQALMESNAESSKTIEELRENVAKFKHKTEDLESTKIHSVNKMEIIKKELASTKQTLQQITFDRNVTRNELTEYQLNFAKESRALKEVLNQTKQAIADVQKRTAEEKSVETEATSSLNPKQTEETDAPILAAEFGRLIVGIADSLTLDQSLQLTMLFNLPSSMSDALCRVSLYQSPGMKFLEEIRNRNIINMYDVTNLQKAFAVLKMENVKQNLLEPYQQQVLEELHDLHKAQEMLTWEDVEKLNAKKKKAAEVQKEDLRIPSDKDLDESAKEELMTKKSENKTHDRVATLGDIHHHSVYIEHNIGKEGGTIHLSGASLIISPGAFLESLVIGISIINEPPFPLPREVDKTRMTPLIKLEPLGLVFQKPVQLTIPHSALIPEPKGVDVIIYSGQMSTNTEGFPDGITWTEERSLSRQLKEKTITVDIQSLCYLSASLLSESIEPSIHIVRAVPFLDGVRNDDDDIIVTVCFCADNESAYSMLMLDYQKKLPLEQYSTLHLCRHSGISNKDKDILSLTISSRNDRYVPDMSQQVKEIAVAHLFAASRVSHQFRLKKNQQTNSDAVELLLTVTQAKNKLTEIFLKTRLKDLMVSQESEDLRLGFASPAVNSYEDLKFNISSMLEKLHCRKLATYFELSPAEVGRVENDSFPGSMLIKIMDEREKIMPQKVIDLFQGLKACHLDKIARLVSEYIDLNSKQSQKTQENKKKIINVLSGIPKDSQRPLKKQQIRAHFSQSDQSAQTMLSSSCITCHHHVETLTYEGYAEKEVVGALDFSQNKLDLARKVLQYVRDQRVLLPKQNILFYKEQYIDENGGEITLRQANVDLLIPVGAVSKGCIVSIAMMTSQHITVPFEGRAPKLAPVINCGQQSIELNKPVTLRIPHCASETEGITSIEMFFGFSSIEGGVQWRERRQHEPIPLLKKDHFEILAQNFGTIGLHVTADYNKRLEKRFRVLPLISRIVNHSEDLTVTLWIYNDDETEHMYLLHEEITVGGKIQLHDFKRFTLKAPGNDKEVHIKSGHNKISPYPNANMKKFMSTVLWQKTRQKAEFYFQNKEGISDIAFKLRLCKAQFLRTSDDLQFDLEITISELLQEPRGITSALLKMHGPHAAMEKSFHELISNMSAKIGLDSCLEIAGIFRLSSTCKDKLKESSGPGNVLLEEIIHKQLISATAVSALDVALTRTGNVRLAEDVREYRRRNTTFATTISSLL